MSNTKIKYDPKSFFEEHMLRKIDLEMATNPNLTKSQAEKSVKKKNNKVLTRLKKEIVPGVSIMLTSTLHERVRHPELTPIQAEDLANRKNAILIAELKSIASTMHGKRMCIYEKFSDSQERILFSRNITSEKNEVLLFLGLWQGVTKKYLGEKELREIASAFSCRLGQRNYHASMIINKTLKAFNKGNKVYFKIEKKEEKKRQKQKAIQRDEKDLKSLVIMM